MESIVIEEYRRGRKTDIYEITEIHKNELKEGFLSSLGDRVLYNLFNFAANSKSGILLIAKDPFKDNIIGFLLGTYNINHFYKEFLWKKTFISILAFLPHLLSFKKIFKIFETLFYPLKKDNVSYPKTELFDIAVSQKYQGTGIAKQLFDKFIQILKDSRYSQVKITSSSSLSGAHIFYEKIGAIKIDEIQVHKGNNTFVYIYRF